MSPARPSRLAGLVVAALAAAAGLVGLSTGSAAAAMCSGGGVQKSCDPNGAGRTGDQVFPAAGFTLSYAQRQPGFVCRVNGSPSSDPCMSTAPANAYWGLFWSDGKSGRWSYASSGVGGLKVPDGGFMAFSWQGSESKDPPSVAPVNRSSPTKSPSQAPSQAPSKTPTPKPASHPTGHTTGTSGQGGSTTGRPAPTGAASALPGTPAAASPGKARAGTARARAGRRAGTTKRPAPSVTPSDTASPSTSQTLDPTGGGSSGAVAEQRASGAFRPAAEHGGLPTWVPIAVIVVLAAGAGGAVLWRRRAASR